MTSADRNRALVRRLQRHAVEQRHPIAIDGDAGPATHAAIDGLLGIDPLRWWVGLVLEAIDARRAGEWAGPLTVAAVRYEIDTPGRLAAWLAQLAHESNRFGALVESMNYTSAGRIREIFKSSFPTVESAAGYVRQPQLLAERVYGHERAKGRALGNTERGDGWRYIGGGLIHTTGRANYAAASEATGYDLIADPDLIRVPGEPAAAVAGWEWWQRGCNELADAGDYDAISRRIGGRYAAGMESRRRLWGVAKAALGVADG